MIGMVTQALLSGGAHLSYHAYLWNIGYSLSIGMPLFANSYLFDKFARRFIDWIKHPVRSIFSALAIHLVYTTIVIFTVNWFWLVVMGDQSWSDFLSRKITFIAQYIIFIMVASIIYAISFFKSWRNEVQQSEMIKREALSLQYQVLQNQVNPHFLFNSLNVLGSLIDLDVEKAKIFTPRTFAFLPRLADV
jgi:two-component system, LytTR family, sensor kinase